MLGVPSASDYYKKLGRLDEQEHISAVRFYMHEYWPNCVQRGDDEKGDFVVETEAGDMLVGYYWREGDHYKVRRATSMNTTRWID
jgi:hypothetical protein